MKGCELCERAARMYCESDQASLCWECDAKVHAANFLVARHSRTLLCRTCQSPTPWRAAGARLGPTVSICHRCSRFLAGEKQLPVIGGDEAGGGGGGGGYGEVAEEEEEEEEIEDEEEELEEDGENQVVPWSPQPQPPSPAAASSSTSEESSSSRSGNRFLKRMRENATELASDEGPTLSPSPSYVALALAPARAPWSPASAKAEDEATSYRPSKERRISAHLRPAPAQAGGSPGSTSMEEPTRPPTPPRPPSSRSMIMEIIEPSMLCSPPPVVLRSEPVLLGTESLTPRHS
ncbi:B-box zinc finger protein 19-like [Cocos nucifera]|uniref:B-box zinc finger protein 19-like n=1 Tax=Cocos nucifera TaxID=13894 RepID=A0A8K0I6A8_COCNU|nr:B-box zinc finger protein 19-like [Cocos nucifera]